MLPINTNLHTLRLSVQRPLSVMVMVVGVYVLSLFLPWITSLAIWVKLTLSTLILIGLFHFLNDNLYRFDKEDVSELILGSDDQWIVKMNSGKFYPADLVNTQYVHPLLTIVFLRYNGKKRYFIFTPELIDKESFRHLRIRLKYNAD